MKNFELLGLSRLADTHQVILGNINHTLLRRIVRCSVATCKPQANRASLKHAGLTANFLACWLEDLVLSFVG